MEEKRKKYQNRGLKIFRDLTENLSAPWKNELDPNNALYVFLFIYFYLIICFLF